MVAELTGGRRARERCDGRRAGVWTREKMGDDAKLVGGWGGVKGHILFECEGQEGKGHTDTVSSYCSSIVISVL